MFEAIQNFLVSPAWAMAPPADGGGGPAGMIGGLMPLILIFAIFYFLLIRPQQKRQKDVAKMQDDLKRGDKVVTTGGIHGLVEKVGDNTVTLKIAENTLVKFGKTYISQVRSADKD
ncbi:MAG: preprotein translocase subunit YajC [Thermodesulfovibrionales bacterium]|nr:preprotein translocase subunit YajC [Thermodesulfovibrionales bacterium]